MPESRRRTRDRNLAKHAAKRQLERMRAARRRKLAVWAGAIAVVLAASFVSALFLFGGKSGSATESPSSPTPTVAPGTQTGTVTPTPPSVSEVACGGTKPDDADAPKPQFAGPPPNHVDANALYTATIRTSCGVIEIRLDPKRAPETVNSFVFLARKHFFDGMLFHRVVNSIDVIQTGDPEGTGAAGGPGYLIPDELKGKLTYTPGTLAMAKGNAPNSGGSQFFIITGPQGTNLDGNAVYTIFGHVTSGLDVAKRINALVPKGQDDSYPSKTVYVESIRITRQAPPSPSPSASATPTAAPS